MAHAEPSSEPDLPPPEDADSDADALPLEDDAAAAPDAAGHVPVLPTQVLSALQPRPGQVYLDCTLGRGGHAALIGPLLYPGGRVIGLDVDGGNLEFARQRLAGLAVPVTLVRANFADARAVLDDLNVPAVDLLLADLGFASNQMSDAARGFSFMRDGPLDMRLDDRQPVTAADLVNELPAGELADLIYQFGEERLSRKIAAKIAEHRKLEPILTTKALADVVRGAYGRHGMRRGPRRGRPAPRIDPATRTFMALRIAVNQELQALGRLLQDLPRLMAPQGVSAIISFHSLEDRQVKRTFAQWRRQEQVDAVTGKPWVAEEEERQGNPRSRSAKLRAVRWTPESGYTAAGQ